MSFQEKPERKNKEESHNQRPQRKLLYQELKHLLLEISVIMKLALYGMFEKQGAFSTDISW